METLQYNGQNVYTNSLNRATVQDLMEAKTKSVKIREVYFFEVDGDKTVVRTDFDKARVLKENRGLQVLVDFKGLGTAGVSIGGLNRICSFLSDTQSLGSDLNVLKGREVTSYNRGRELIGIGVNA